MCVCCLLGSIGLIYGKHVTVLQVWVTILVILFVSGSPFMGQTSWQYVFISGAFLSDFCAVSSRVLFSIGDASLIDTARPCVCVCVCVCVGVCVFSPSTHYISMDTHQSTHYIWPTHYHDRGSELANFTKLC